jgi:hypothetical protein
VPLGEHALGCPNTGVRRAILQAIGAVAEVMTVVTMAEVAAASEVGEARAEAEYGAEREEHDPEGASHGIFFLSAAVAMAVVAVMAEAVRTVLDEITQNLPLAFVERLVHLARGVDAGAPHLFECCVVAHEHFAEPGLVELLATQRVGDGAPRVVDLAAGVTRAPEELVHGGRNDLFLPGRGVEPGEEAVQGAARAEAAPVVAVMPITITPAVAAAGNHPHEADQAKRAENETEHGVVAPS